MNEALSILAEMHAKDRAWQNYRARLSDAQKHDMNIQAAFETGFYAAIDALKKGIQK